MITLFFLFLFITITIAREQVNCIPRTELFSDGFYYDNDKKCQKSETEEQDINYIIASDFVFDTTDTLFAKY